MTRSSPDAYARAAREQLVAERADTTARADALAADLAGIIAASASGATDDEHDPEGATIAFERAQVAALLDEARDRLVDLDRVLERLAARPAATTCVRCASARRR